MSNNKKTIASIASNLLEEQGKLLSIDELYTIIIDEELYSFKEGANAKHILEIVLKRKCINKNLSFKNKESIFFYHYESNKYGLLSWLSEEQKNTFIEESKKYRVIKENDNSIISEKKDKYIDEITGLQIISVLSFVWVLFIIMFFFNDGGSKLDLNAMGDYLAGFFAPVLFLWLVYGVFLQKEEFGKVVDSFKLQQREFADSVKTMKDQVVQVEVQHLHTWFSRNIRTIDSIKVILFNNIKVQNIDSIGLINEQLKDDVTTEKEYFNIFDELKSILSIIIYIEEHLDDLSEQKKDNGILLESIEELKKEFEMLMGEDIKNIKEIMSIVFVLIECRKDSEYKRYNIYQNWIENNSDILSLLENKRQGTLKGTLQTIMRITPKLSMQMNFKTGEINGSI